MSKKTESAKPKAMDNNFVRSIIHLGGVLFAITAVVAGLLGTVNAVTEDQIEINARKKLEDAMTEIAPNADSFEAISLEGVDPIITDAYQIISGGQYAGVIVQSEPAGFSGPITIISGFDADGAVLGVRITKIIDTPGLGEKAKDQTWLDQYAGVTGPFSVTKSAKVADTEITALTSATITSEAVTDGINIANAFAQSYDGGAN